MDLKYSIKKNVRLLTGLTYPRQQWNIGVVNRPIQSFVEEKEYEVEWFPLPLPDGTYYLADPFGAKVDGETCIFMEEYDYIKRKGKISYIKLNERNDPSKIETAIEKPYHMSYPYLFEYEKEVYCIPEAFENNEVTIYKIRTPSNWERKYTVVKGIDVVDPSLIEYDGRWWLFFTRVYDDTNLYLWYAEDLFGDWNPHKNNPVKTDISSSRSAGTMFIHDGKLYRPAQDCKKHYGANVVVNQVMKISPTEFHEEPVSVITPNDVTLNGVHTISSLGEMTLIDGFRFVGRDRIWVKGRISSVVRYLSRKQSCTRLDQ